MSGEGVMFGRTWVRQGRLFLGAGWMAVENGGRYWISRGEFALNDGWLIMNGPLAEGEERRHGPDRRCGSERRHA